MGNSGVASTGVFNAGGFNTGLMNAGSYNTGSFNAGDANTGDFNPGSVNTGWLNTGDTNTGLANSGNVNTGALISGNYSNGTLWRGNFQGLLGPLSTGLNVLPQMPLSVDINGGVGAITIQPIHILPEIPINIHETLYLGPWVVPPIDVPAMTLDIGIPHVSIGPIKLNPITLWPAQHVDYNATFAWPISTVTIPGIQQVALSPSPIPLTLIGPIHINTGFLVPITFSFDTPALTLFPNGVSIPDTPLSLALGMTVGTDAFSIPGFSIPEQAIPLTIDLVGHIDALSTPAITIDYIPLNLQATGHAGPVGIPGINVAAMPGFGNSTIAPSSGFFNSGAGGSSGFGNVGAHLSGIGNVGAQLSGLLSGSGLGNIGSDNFGLGSFGWGNTGIGNSAVAHTGIFNTLGIAQSPVVFPQSLNFGTISEIPAELRVLGAIGPIHVEPIPIPEFNVHVTGGFIGLREFTLPEITIPAIPIHLSGFLELQGFHVSPTPILPALDASLSAMMNPLSLPSPLITLDNYGPPLGGPGAKFPVAPFYLSISDLKINGPMIGGGNPGVVTPLSLPFNLSTTPLTLFPTGVTIPDQTPLRINLSGGLDSITLFPGGLKFPENPLVSLTNFSLGTSAFTIFPQGFTIDSIPVDLHTSLGIGPIPLGWGYIPPSPANGPIAAVPGGFGITSGLFPLHLTLTGDIGPISIPATPVLDAIKPLLAVTGNIEIGPFTLPDIPIPAVNLSLDGNVDLSFSAPATTLLSGLGIAGGLDIPQIQIASLSTQPAKIYMAVGNTLMLFDFRDGITLNPIIIPGSSIPFSMAELGIPFGGYSNSIPINLSFGSQASTIKSMVLDYIQPINLSVDLEAMSLPATVIPAIPLNMDLITPVGPINIPIISMPGSGNSTSTPASGPFAGFDISGLNFGFPNAGESLLSLFDGSFANRPKPTPKGLPNG
nr:hypothetical protein [Mycobacterium asiaticum]